MAEFKLGRIRFVWKGTWTTATTYVKDDVIRQGGKLFLCVTGHTASADFTTDSANWNLVSDGLAWTGNWNTSTYYKLNDLVKYGGVVYICNTTHTSASTTALGLENDLSKWTVFANSFNWIGNWATSTRYKAKDVVKYGAETYVCKTGHTSAATTALGLENDQSSWDVFSDGLLWQVDWATSTRYKLNDVVRYGGLLYVCNTAHTSASTASAGLETDQSKWDYLHKGFNYLGAWSGSSVRYKVNDVVKYGADLWICTTYHTSSASFSTSNFTKFIEGLQYFNTWNSGTTYQPNDLVTYGGFVYIANSVHTNVIPSTDGGTNWSLFTSGFTYIGAWSSVTAYQVGNVVTVGGYTYVATADGTNQNPATAGSYWSRLNSGFRWLATAQTFTAVTTTNVTGSGSGAQFTVAISGTTYTVTKTANGTGYSATAGSNTIKILGTQVGGITPFNDITITITAVSTGAISTFTYTGIATTWASGTVYVLGDTVFYGPSTYVCILGHTAASGNSPGADSTGTYWNLMAQGTSTSVLTTQGDMVYYGGAGPTRLPIGTTGQVLTVGSNGLPGWTYWGIVNQVYYVSTTTGTNSPAPAYGTTVDKPWATIKYALNQVEAGPQFPAATNLLARNRSYIQAEVIAWINYQITNNLAPFSTGFTYNATKCSRDIGFIVDALVYDLSHGGNQKVVAAAQAYVNALTGTNPSTTGTYSLLSAQASQDVAGYNYMVTIIQRIIQNLAPTSTYQATVTRVSDSTQTAETGASTLITNLTGVVTAAITAQNATNIPATVVPNYSIFVKTGVYYETLPLIVPQSTAVIGDELRSTNVQPAPAGTAYATDAAVTIATWTRLSTIMSNLLTNAAVTPSTGNTVSQVTTRPASNSTVVTQVQGLFTNLNAYINYYVNSTGSAPTMTGTNTPTQTQANYEAVQILTENLAFLQAEATAYINSTYTTTATATASGANITVNSSANFTTNMRVVFSGTTFGGVQSGTVYYVTSVPNSTTIQVSTTKGGSAQTWSSATGTMTVTMYYNQAQCQNDVAYVIKGIQYDIVYTGNYKTLVNAQAYSNAILGSVTQNMFLVRNGTGLRNMTLQGLTGTLGSANSYGTRRPTAGAYVSLDPGWGTADSRVWINTRSPYPQNVTMFGTGCIGMKVDGTLHAGGNRSIVANDFTTVLSDGIGAWVTGPNALTELVSVFSYYGYAGYLAEAGGKIRATNGNSSYGTYGVLAEGVDSTETPLTVQINNRANQALITNTLTDGVNNIWRFEYLNAGSNYNSASYSISGSGYNAASVANEFRDNAVFETRAFSTGSTYVSYANAGQSTAGNLTMTIAATDSSITNAYLGMRIILTAGTGAGQTGYIVGNNAGSKVAYIAKESVPTITASQTINSSFTASAGYISNNIMTLPTVSAGTPAAGAVISGLGVTANSYITAVNSASFTGAIAPGTAVTFTASISGTTMTVTSAPTGTGIVPGMVISGGSIPAGAYVVANLTGTGTSTNSTWTVNATITQSSTTVTATPVVLTASAVTGQISVGQVVTGTGVGAGTVIIALGNGTGGAGTYYVTPSQTAAAIACTSVSYTVSPTQTVGNFNSTITITGAQNGIVVPSTASLYSGMPLYMTGTTIGGLQTVTPYYVLSAGLLSNQFAVSTAAGGSPVNLSNQTASTMIINAAGWDHVVPGTAIAANLDTTTTYIIEPRVTYSSPGFTPTAITQQSGSWVDLAYTDINATYSSVASSGGTGSSATFTVVRTGVAYAVTLSSAGSGYTIGDTLTVLGTSLGGTVVNNITITVTNIGSSPSAGVITNFTYSGIGAGGVYVAIPSSGTATQYSYNGSTWVAGGALPSSQSWTALAAGNSAWIAVATGTNATAVSTNGTTWAAGGNLPVSSTWTGIGYGNGVWQAVAANTTNVAYSSNNGTSWTLSSGGLPASSPWVGVAYGNGVWVAISGGTSASSQAAYSTNGTSWVTASLPSSQIWTSVAFGRGRFVAIAETGNIAAYSLNGTTWTASPSGLPVTQTWGYVRYGQGLFMATGFALSPTISATTAGTNQVTISSSTGLSVGETFVPTAVTRTPTVTGSTTATAVMNSSSISGTTLTVGSIGSGTISVGMVLTGTNVVTGTYIVSGGGLTWVVSISQTVSSTTITGTNNIVTVSSTTGITAGQSFIPTAVTTTGNLTTTTAAGVSLTLNNSTPLSNGNPIVFNVGTTYTPNLTATAAGTNLATLSSTSGIVQGQSIIFNTVTQTPQLLVSSSTGNLLYLSSGAGLVANESIIFTAGTQSPTLTFANGANNQLTLSTTNGLVVGEPIVFTSVTQTPSAATATTNATASMTGSTINSSGVLTVGTLASGTIAVGMVLTGTNVVTSQAITVTGATGTGTSAILTFSAQASTPFVTGQTITVTGILPAGYNGTYVVTGASTSSVTYANTTTGSLTQQGLVTSPLTYITANISGSGSGSTWQTSVNFAVASTTITGTNNLITLGSTTGMVVGEPIVFSGTAFGGITSGTTYYITEIIGATQVAVSAIYAGTNLTLSTATGSMTVVAGGSFGGITSATTYYITSIQGSQVTVSTSYGGSNATVSNVAGAWTSSAGATMGTGISSGTTYYIQATNTASATLNTSSISGYVLTVGTVGAGTITVGMVLTGSGVGTGTYITQNISGSGAGSTWYVSISQTVSSTTITGTANTVTVGLAAGSGALTMSNAAGLWTSVAGSVFGNLTSGTTYYVASVSGSTVTVSTSPTLSPVVALSNGAGAWTSLAGSVIGGVQAGFPYYVLTNNTGTNTITVATTFSGSPLVVTNGVGSWTWTGGGAWTNASITAGFISNGVGPTGIGAGTNLGTVFTPNGTVTGSFATGMILSGTGLIPNTTTISSVNSGTFTSGSVSATTVSTTGTVGSISGSGPWTAAITGMSSTYGLVVGAALTSATAGTGTLYGGTPTSVIVTSITSPTSITYTVTGGTTPTAGTVTNIIQPVVVAGASSTGLSAGMSVAGVTAGTYLVANYAPTGTTLVSATFTSTAGSTVITLSSFTTGTISTVAVGQQIVTGSNSSFVGPVFVTAVNTTASTITINQPLLAAINGVFTIIAAGQAVGNWAVAGLGVTGITGTPTTGTSYTVSTSQATGSTAITGYAVSGAYNLAGLVSGNTYYVLTVPASGQVTVGTAYGSSPQAVTGSVAAWTSVFGSVFGGLLTGTTYYIASISGNNITLSTNSALTPVAILSTQGGSWNSTAGQTNVAATSEDGITWARQTLSASSTWPISVFGNPSSTPTWVALTSGTTTANTIVTGATAQARVKITSNQISEWRIVEPGSGYATVPTVTITDPNQSATPVSSIIASVAVADTAGTLTVTSGTYYVGQAITISGSFSAGSITGYTTGTTYYVGKVNSATSIQITNTYANATASSPVFSLTTTTGTATPGATFTTNFFARTGIGALANPTWTNRGTAYATVSSVAVTGNGYSDLYQVGAYVNVSGIYTTPTPGSNITLPGDPNYYKLVAITNLVSSGGGLAPYTATFQINPAFTTGGQYPAPAHNATATLRLKYSQVRLTGHDFLNVGTGNQVSTNYPGTPAIAPDSTKQTVAFGGGRTFFTSTDQDGNFNVGNLFTVVQSTGVATLNANAFNLAGLQSLTLGSVAVGSGSATITQFSTDPYFTANSDSIVPTQKAIKSYISSQIGGGGSTLNVNTLTAGVIYISGNSISTTTGVQITVNNKMYFVGGVDGVPLAMNFLLS